MTEIDPAVREWAVARLQDITSREMEHSYELSERKPLGSSVVPAADVDRVTRELLARGYCTHSKAIAPGTVVLYAYLPDAALRVIAERSNAAGEPTRMSAHEWVRMLAVTRYTPKTWQFDLVADLYGDRTGPGRRDVLPTVDPRALLDGFHAVHGFLDPTFVFFE